jgi:hypothetical protein
VIEAWQDFDFSIAAKVVQIFLQQQNGIVEMKVVMSANKEVKLTVQLWFYTGPLIA